MQQLHPIPPVFDRNSHILILGSFPSVQSRETQFFYGHPQNRFWRVLVELFKEELPTTTLEKKAMLLRHRIALWDVIASCEITGSTDSSIKNVVPNDLTQILTIADIDRIYANGKTAEKLYAKHIYPQIHRAAVFLPSTSPANAAWTYPRLLAAWSVITQEGEKEI